jgi:esterase/lipase superfamily enzyme
LDKSENIDELILAAPDVDVDYYKQVVPKIVHLAERLTLYASSNDKALQLSRLLARSPRAGDIINGLPSVVPGVETIDVSSIGAEIFGLNHDVFASNRSAIDDIGLILRSHLHPPDARLSEIHGMPANATPPNFWRYVQ